jgi:hypothetical protein
LRDRAFASPLTVVSDPNGRAEPGKLGVEPIVSDPNGRAEPGKLGVELAVRVLEGSFLLEGKCFFFSVNTFYVRSLFSHVQISQLLLHSE